MSILKDYARVTKRRPCPICEKPDWCLLHRDGTKAVCARTPSPKVFGEAGWVHDIDAAHGEPIRLTPRQQTIGIDMTGVSQRFEDALEMDILQRLADNLGVEPVSLDRLRIGWSRADSAFTFPMRDSGGTIVGIRLRNLSGEKWSIRGGREGLFYSPLDLKGDQVFVVEGPTDTAALLDMGVTVIGRPSCNGGLEQLLKMVRASHHLVIVADRDGPGTLGAETLADRCSGVCRSVRVIEPLRGKDVREWKQMGMSRDGLRRVVQNSTTWCRPTPGNSSTPRPTSATPTAVASPSTPSCAEPA